MKNDVSAFNFENEIIHQTSCSYTSQRNGIAEHKHKHILDFARTIMIYMHVSKFLWSDIVLSACYLINKMPSSVLNRTITFFYLYPNKVSFPWLLMFLAVRVLFRTCLLI